MTHQTQACADARFTSIHFIFPVGALLAFMWVGAPMESRAQQPLRESLKALPFQIVCESYIENNWELTVMKPDGSAQQNLTHSARIHEHYPQVSPDGKKICFSVDDGEGRETVRSLWVMDRDGQNRKKLVDYAREPFWAPDSKVIGFLPQEYPKFSVTDYYTRGISFYHLQSGQIEVHPNTTNLHHLYNPSYARNGKWVVATVHAGMGVDHGILLIESHGPKILNLQIPGCRPCFSPDGKQLAWGADDHTLVVAPINLDVDTPTVGPRRFQVKDLKNKIYHVDWSPDSRFLCFSRGPDGKGDLSKTGTFQGACEMVGVYAPGWNLCVVSAEKGGVLDLDNAPEGDFLMLTSSGSSYKEPAWMPQP